MLWDMNYVCIFSVFVLPCVDKGLLMGRSPIQRVLLNVYKYDSKTREMRGLLTTRVCRAMHKKQTRKERLFWRRRSRMGSISVTSYENLNRFGMALVEVQ
jgi:hypothetical protein